MSRINVFRVGVVNAIKTWSQYVVENNLKAIQAPEFPFNDEINSKISLWQGDITHLHVDAIVNAANEALLGGGGIDGAIHKAAGPSLLDECRKLNGCKTGSAKITGGHKLPALNIIHAVGPKGKKPELLHSTYEACLRLMLENNIRSAAFPCISTGIYGYPPQDAVHEAARAIRNFLEHNFKVDRIIFTVFSDADKKIYEKELLNYFPTAVGHIVANVHKLCDGISKYVCM